MKRIHGIFSPKEMHQNSYYKFGRGYSFYQLNNSLWNSDPEEICWNRSNYLLYYHWDVRSVEHEILTDLLRKNIKI